MKRIIVRVAGALGLLAAVAVLLGVPYSPRTANADPANIFIINTGICTALTTPTTTAGCTATPSNGLQYGTSAPGDEALVQVSNLLGNNNNVIEPSDFTGIGDPTSGFTGNQVHQNDGAFATSLSNFAVIAFVNNVGPVTFHTTEGTWTANSAATWTCDGTGAVGSPTSDSDCGGPNSTDTTVTYPSGATPYRLGPDHVVVAYLSCTVATCPLTTPDNPAQLTVEQGGVVYPYNFTVVGEPRTVQFFTLESAIQAGVPVSGALTHASASAACPFSASLPFIQKALGEAEKTVIVARALDINGNAISGAWINWTVDNGTTPTNPTTFYKDGSIPTNYDSEGILSQPYTPTLNLGGFGYGAPNILCAPATAPAGKVTVRATIAKFVEGTISADPGATAGAWAETTFDVNAIPAAVTLAADPASIACDGSATSTVTATLTDAAGNPAISGTAVHFDVQALGTANPIDTTTNDKGVATSTITPLSATGRGVPVTVSVSVGGVVQPNLTQSVLVQCNGAAAPAAAPGGPSAAPSAPSAAPSGTITAPNTGTGGLSTGIGTLSWWPALYLLAAAAALSAVRIIVDRRQR